MESVSPNQKDSQGSSTNDPAVQTDDENEDNKSDRSVKSLPQSDSQTTNDDKKNQDDNCSYDSDVDKRYFDSDKK